MSSSLARLTHLHRVQSGLLCDLEMALSASVVKVFVIGKGFFTSHILLADVKDAGDFVAAIQRKFALSDIDALHLELRVVSTEPDRDNATALFDASAFEIKNSATLPKPGAWVVGKIVALQSAAGAAASVNGAAYALAGSGAGAGSVAGERWSQGVGCHYYLISSEHSSHAHIPPPLYLFHQCRRVQALA